MEAPAPARSDEVVLLAIAGWCSVGMIWFLVESQFHTAGSVLDDEAREGRIRTQTTTFCFDSDDDDDDEQASAGFEGDAIGVGEGVASSSLTVARPESTLTADGVDSVEVVVCSDAELLSLAAAAFVKGEDLAAEPTLAFLAIVAEVEIRCSEEVVWAMLERRFAGVGEDWALIVVVALEVRGEVRRVVLRGTLAA